MNGKIALAVVIAFAVVLLSFIPFYQMFRVHNVWEIENDPFFIEQEASSKNKVFILGGSAVGQLNTTTVNEIVSNKHENYDVYNLAYNGDLPNLRTQSLDSTINAKPMIVFYGISYWSLSDYQDQKGALDLIAKNLLNIDSNVGSINPKVVTLNAIKIAFGDETGLFPKDKIKLKNEQFFFFSEDQTVIASNEQLKKLGVERTLAKVHQNPAGSDQLRAFKDTIEKLQKNNIRVVVFTLPLHKNYLQVVPEEDKKIFRDTLDEISQDYGVKIYDFTDKYSELNVWKDPYHIALNPKSIAFSRDIAQMILSEIES
jgi:hypothetical protein